VSARPTVPVAELSATVVAGLRADMVLHGPEIARMIVTGHVRQVARYLDAAQLPDAGVSLALAVAAVRALDEIHPAGGAR
jgi:hypothetical protein